MRNPLSAILQSAESIIIALEDARKASPGSAPVSLDAAEHELIYDSALTIAICAQHQKRIVDDILTLSKLDSRLLVVTPAEVNPVTTVKHALKLHSQELRVGYVLPATQLKKS